MRYEQLCDWWAHLRCLSTFSSNKGIIAWMTAHIDVLWGPPSDNPLKISPLVLIWQRCFIDWTYVFVHHAKMQSQNWLGETLKAKISWIVCFHSMDSSWKTRVQFSLIFRESHYPKENHCYNVYASFLPSTLQLLLSQSRLVGWLAGVRVVRRFFFTSSMSFWSARKLD